MFSTHSFVRIQTAALAVLLLAPAALAQDIDVQRIFTNTGFYEEQGILESDGEITYLADVWVLPGPQAGSRTLVGLTMANRALQFVRANTGRWLAGYSVSARFEGEEEPIERSWDRTVEVATFDETLLTRETIVFQAEVPLPAGSYEMTLEVTDGNGERAGVVRSSVEVPEYRPDVPALGPPVLLRFQRDTPDGVEWVVHPSRYFHEAPEQIDFLVQAGGVDFGSGSAPYRIRAVLSGVPVGEETEGDSVGGWSGPLSPAGDGVARAFAKMSETGARFGEYRLRAILENEAGEELAHGETSFLVAGSDAWIIENWDDTLSLLKYEATQSEMEILEDIEDPDARIAAWNCFWDMRDPVPTTATNEALRRYLSLIQIANENWTSTLRPGYLSDRGRVFITMGAPDHIDRDPFPRGGRAFEVWRYERGRQFEIAFVDRIGFDNYQLHSLDTYHRELRILDQRKVQFLRERADRCPLLAEAYEKE